MEDFRSLFIATGTFVALALTIAHVRHPNDSVFTSAAHADARQHAQVVQPLNGSGPTRTAALDRIDATGPASRPTAPLFDPTPLATAQREF